MLEQRAYAPFDENVPRLPLQAEDLGHPDMLPRISFTRAVNTILHAKQQIGLLKDRHLPKPAQIEPLDRYRDQIRIAMLTLMLLAKQGKATSVQLTLLDDKTYLYPEEHAFMLHLVTLSIHVLRGPATKTVTATSSLYDLAKHIKEPDSQPDARRVSALARDVAEQPGNSLQVTQEQPIKTIERLGHEFRMVANRVARGNFTSTDPVLEARMRELRDLESSLALHIMYVATNSSSDLGVRFIPGKGSRITLDFPRERHISVSQPENPEKRDLFNKLREILSTRRAI